MNLISKKDLLAITGISYGQLYRWKREGIIPEEWFIKQSSYTGQETFFPREQILSRVKSILDMKDTHSLDELAEILSPNSLQSAVIEIETVEEINLATAKKITEYFGKSAFTVLELSVIISLTRFVEGTENSDLLHLLSEGLSSKIETADYTCTIFSSENSQHVLFVKGSEKILFPPVLHLLSEFHLAAVSDSLNGKYILRRN